MIEAAIREIADDSPVIKNRVKNYWTERAAGFCDLREAELQSNKAARWYEEIMALLPQKQNLRILDVGCGTGFFEVLLAKCGHQIIGIDITPEMIEKSAELLELHGVMRQAVQTMVMDAEKLDFSSERFDVVISRNLTWTLPNPADAYREWYRVLKPNGVLLNFDAEYAKGEKRYFLPPEHAHNSMDDGLKNECHELYQLLTLSTMNRPNWDKAVLKQVGFKAVAVDTAVGERIYREQDQFYIPDKMFGIRAQKGITGK